MEKEWFDLADTMVKIGLGAIISVLGAYKLSVLNHKKDIDKFKQQADIEERKGNLQKVAELRYGKIPTIEEAIKKDEKKLGRAIIRLFYLALPPSLFETVVKNVETCKLGKKLCTVQHVRSRVILEKGTSGQSSYTLTSCGF